MEVHPKHRVVFALCMKAGYEHATGSLRKEFQLSSSRQLVPMPSVLVLRSQPRVWPLHHHSSPANQQHQVSQSLMQQVTPDDAFFDGITRRTPSTYVRASDCA